MKRVEEVNVYEDGALKPVLRRRTMEGRNLTPVHCMYIWKCYKRPPVQLLHTKKKIFKKRC
jgi:hypothetical protein